MQKSAKVLIALGLVAAAGVAAVAVVVSEGALHIPTRRRFAAHAAMADRIAQAAGATWTTRQMAAADGTPGTQLWEPEGATHTKASSFYPGEFERRVVGWFDGH